MAGPQYNKTRCDRDEFFQRVEQQDGDVAAAERLWLWLIEDKQNRQPDRPASEAFLTWGHLLAVADEGDKPVRMRPADWQLLKRTVDDLTCVS